MSMPPNPLLEDQLADPLWERFLHSPTSGLARASRPDCLGDEPTPLQWVAEDWDRLEAERRDILDLDELEAQFDRDTYLRDGYAVLRGIVPPSVIETWTKALQYGQRRNDALLQADWSQIDWLTLGRRPPKCQLSAEAIAGALGGSQKAPQKTDEAGVLTLRRHSVFTEYFPAGHVPFLMDVLTHPQAHGVASKGTDRQTRWCSLYAYKKADDRTGLVPPPHAVPPLWALKAQRGELPPVLTELLRPSFDRASTGGRTQPYQN